MAVIRVLATRATSNAATLTRLAGGGVLLRPVATGLGINVSTDGLPPLSLPPAHCQGDLPSSPFGVRAFSCVAAGGGGAGAVPVADKKIGVPGTGGGKVASVAGFLGTAGGAAGSSSSIVSRPTLSGGGRPCLRPPTTGIPVISFANRRVLPARPFDAVRAYSNSTSDTEFSRLWGIEQKVGICQETIKGVEKAAALSNKEIHKLHRDIVFHQSKLLSSMSVIRGSASLKNLVVRKIISSLVWFAMLALVGTCTCWYIGLLDKEEITKMLTDLAHTILQSPEVQRDVEATAERAGGAIRRGVFSRSSPNKISKYEFADRVNTFSFAVYNVMASSEGRCTQETLLTKLKQIGYDDSKMNMAMLSFLSKHGYLTEASILEGRTKKQMVYYSCPKDALKECESGVMKVNIRKAVKESTLQEMLMS